MAIVRQMKQLTLDRDVPHSEAECTYSLVTGELGERYLQIDTYGSIERMVPGKKSQSVRFAPEAIEQLKRLLQEYF